jgi:predicted CXXCH cytochrome family protein
MIMRSALLLGPLFLLPLNAFAQTSPGYAGSAACKTCHPAVYNRWSKTLMANVVRDPKVHPEAILPDLSKPSPLVNFTKNDIALVYGSKWKQRYFTKKGDDYYALGAQWDVSHQIWRAYHAAPGTDWWTAVYPTDNMQRPTGPLCDGCHSVDYNIATKTPAEWNVGCEKCHGPGAAHAAKPSRENIVNPARLDFVRANDVCIQCHSQGQPLTNPIQGKYYDWPVGFEAGKNLQEFWKLEDHKLGEKSFTHFGDGTAHKNRMQGNDFVTSLMYTHGVSCFSCHDVHGTENNADLVKPANVLCLNATARIRRMARALPPSKRIPTTRRAAPVTTASTATCRKLSRRSPTSTFALTRSNSSLPPPRRS